MGIPKDDVLAYMWFNLAASQGDKDAVQKRDEIGKRLTPEQLAEAQKRSREWFEKFQAKKKDDGGAP
jgi:localization factor PodJL